MEPLKIIVADDEEKARQLVQFYLKEIPEPFVAQETSDGVTTLKMIRQYQPDIVFLDIKMPELDGIGVLRSIGPENSPAIILTTAFDQYALPAFEFDAVDYLLKPFEQERFNKAVQKAIRYLRSGGGKTKHTYLSRLSIKMGNKTILLPVEEVDYFQANGSYVNVITKNNSFLISTHLYELEKILNPDIFVRIHKSTILNISSVKAMAAVANDSVITLKSGKDVRASRNYKEKLIAALSLKK